MNKLNLIATKRTAAAIAVIAGLITGGILGSQPYSTPQATSTGVAQVDPSIPALTVVAKRLSFVEKHRLADRTITAPAAREAVWVSASAL